MKGIYGQTAPLRVLLHRWQVVIRLKVKQDSKILSHKLDVHIEDTVRNKLGSDSDSILIILGHLTSTVTSCSDA